MNLKERGRLEQRIITDLSDASITDLRFKSIIAENFGPHKVGMILDDIVEQATDKQLIDLEKVLDENPN